jgi:hypothetical protein
MNPNPDESGNAPLKITINGQEFDSNEAQELIDAGRKTRELETQYNTKLDKVWPEYGRSQQELKRLASIEKERDEAREQLKAFQTKKEEGIETPNDVKNAQEAARKVGLVVSDDLEKAGYIRKDTLESYLSERDQKQEEQRRATEAVLKEADRHQSEINGSDGRPKFKKELVLAYASAYNKPNLMDAYNEMYKDELDAYKQEQIDREKAKGLKTLKGTGFKEPKQPRVTNSNFEDILREALSSSND